MPGNGCNWLVSFHSSVVSVHRSRTAPDDLGETQILTFTMANQREACDHVLLSLGLPHAEHQRHTHHMRTVAQHGKSMESAAERGWTTYDDERNVIAHVPPNGSKPAIASKSCPFRIRSQGRAAADSAQVRKTIARDWHVPNAFAPTTLIHMPNKTTRNLASKSSKACQTVAELGFKVPTRHTLGPEPRRVHHPDVVGEHVCSLRV